MTDRVALKIAAGALFALGCGFLAWTLAIGVFSAAYEILRAQAAEAPLDNKAVLEQVRRGHRLLRGTSGMPETVRRTGERSGSHPRRSGFRFAASMLAIAASLSPARADGARVPDFGDAVHALTTLNRGEILAMALTLGVLLFGVVTAIMLVKEFGGKVYATAGSKEKCDACVKLGATAAINYKEQDFVEAIRALTDKKGADVILDIVGAPYVQRNLSALAHGGKLVMIAFMEGNKTGEFNFGPVVVKHLTITGSTLRPRSVELKSKIAQSLRQNVWPLLEKGAVRPVIHATFPLEQAREAHQLMESSAHQGKIMLEIRK